MNSEKGEKMNEFNANENLQSKTDNLTFEQIQEILTEQLKRLTMTVQHQVILRLTQQEIQHRNLLQETVQKPLIKMIQQSMLILRKLLNT